MPPVKEVERPVQVGIGVDKMAANALVEAQIKILTASYDKMAAYTNLVVVAGYATFFGLWNLTKDILSPDQKLWSALLIAISASVFVIFEVTKNYFHSRNIMKLNKIVTDPKITASAPKVLAAFDKHNQKLNKHMLAWGIWWHVSWVVSVVCGIAGAGVLMYAFIVGLL
ncbi:hypothetical protein P6A00_004601 [Vibrio parahaemolyticus]|uniref:Uncharacterized protein n=2 Tax=Vibrio parahaemolyticus TaxID=670 RepID=A0A9Q3UJ91_VIBPH|nr:hypothetical protein [Vibrio parahaemolyticus]EGQ7800831.1 hypothetical protein [Vibrio parahaemolyticus]EGQ8113014.1 hypothetical protein [Vibrio parahaemolyticus]EGQ8200777.1 hypothetical protein [Vibrio parahaemolyticus]EGQ8551868.1 hypothetical protein [Vibrio parahaemolyticus]EGQ9075233.1 hypothetical protein [Vibrio parahaemolyticus]